MLLNGVDFVIQVGQMKFLTGFTGGEIGTSPAQPQPQP
jgi:hypothetical protein